MPVKRFLVLAALLAALPAVSGAQSLVSADAVLSPAATIGGLPAALDTVDLLTAQPPFLTTTFAYSSVQGLEASITGTWRAELQLENPHNVPVGPKGNRVAIENNSVTEGYLGYAGESGWVRAGRQDLSLGPSRLSNLHVSQPVPFLDAVAYGLEMGRWSLTHAIATLYNRRGANDIGFAFARDDYDFEISTILLSARRFAWHAPRATLGIGAQAVVSRDYNAFALGDVFPVFSIHNAKPGKNNLFISFDGELALSENVAAYALLGLDDINGATVGIADGPIPTIWALIGGVKADWPARRGRQLAGTAITLDAELGYTHALWGSFEDSHPLSRSIYRLYADGSNRLMPLSSPYGPARLWTRATAAIPIGKTVVLAPDVLVLAGDPEVDLVSLPYAPVSATLRYLLARLSLGGTWTPTPTLSASLRPEVDFRPGSVDLRLTIGGTWRYGFDVAREE